jgi:hypothetical protein
MILHLCYFYLKYILHVVNKQTKIKKPYIIVNNLKRHKVTVLMALMKKNNE